MNNTQNNDINAAAKNAEISRRILALVAKGVDITDAMRTVCGVEATDTMIEGIYNSLRSPFPPPASDFPEYAKPGQRLPRLRDRA